MLDAVRSEQRKSVRLPIPDAQQEAELRFGKIRFPVQLTDQSADGFGAISPQAPGVEIGTKGILRSGVDWYEIRLTNIISLAPSLFAESATSENQKRKFRLGLRRVGDAVNPEVKHTWTRLVFRICLSKVTSPGSTMVGFGMLFVIVVFLLPTVAISFFSQERGHATRDSVRLVKSIAAVADFENRQVNSGAVASGAPAKSASNSTSPPAGVHPGRKATWQAPLGNYLDELKAIIHRTPGPAVFLLPNVAQELDITAQQQRQIQDIIDITEQALSELGRQISEENPQERERINRELFEIARKSALKLLTEQQQSQWQKLSVKNLPQENVTANEDIPTKGNILKNTKGE